MLPKAHWIASSVIILSAHAASAALFFPFTNTNTYRSIDYLDGNQGTQWSAFGKVEPGGSVTDYSAIAPDGNRDSVRQVGIGSDYGVGGSAGGQRGYLFSISDGANNYFTTYATFSSELVSSITWDMGNTNSTSRLLVQSGGNWYVTQEFFTTLNMDLATFQASPESKAVNLATATWFTYNITTLTVNTGTPATLPSMNLTGVGFHVLNSGDNIIFRLDNLNLIPEPSAMLLSAVGALGLLRRRR